MAEYSDLDCSFAALASFVSFILLAVCLNVGIPSALVVAPTQRDDVFRMLAEALDRAGFPARIVGSFASSLTKGGHENCLQKLIIMITLCAIGIYSSLSAPERWLQCWVSEA
jgi:hypothetical protein